MPRDLARYQGNPRFLGWNRVVFGGLRFPAFVERGLSPPQYLGTR